MSMFRELLWKTSERLDLPQPVKSRIILEIAADLQDIYDECIEKGMSDEEARSRAVELRFSPPQLWALGVLRMLLEAALCVDVQFSC